MKYTGPIHWRFVGANPNRLPHYASVARNYLGGLIQRANLGGVDVLAQNIILSDDTIIRVGKYRNIYVASIIVEPVDPLSVETLPHFLPFLSAVGVEDSFENTLSRTLQWSWLLSDHLGGNIDWRGPGGERDIVSWAGYAGRHVYSRENTDSLVPLSSFQGATYRSGLEFASPPGITVMGAARVDAETAVVCIGHDALASVKAFVLPFGAESWIEIGELPTVRSTAVIAFDSTGYNARGISWHTGGGNSFVSSGFQHEIQFNGTPGLSMSVSIEDTTLGITDYQPAGTAATVDRPVAGIADPFGKQGGSDDWIAFGLWVFETNVTADNRYLPVTGTFNSTTTVTDDGTDETTTIVTNYSYSGSDSFTETFTTTNPQKTIDVTFTASCSVSHSATTVTVRRLSDNSLISKTHSETDDRTLTVNASFPSAGFVTVYSSTRSTTSADGQTDVTRNEEANLIDYILSSGVSQRVRVTGDYDTTNYDPDIISSPPPNTGIGSQSYSVTQGTLGINDDYISSSSGDFPLSSTIEEAVARGGDGNTINLSNGPINAFVQVPWIMVSGSGIRSDVQNPWPDDVLVNPFWCRRQLAVAANLHAFPSLATKLYSPTVQVLHGTDFQAQGGDGARPFSHPIALDYDSSDNPVEVTASGTYEGFIPGTISSISRTSYSEDALPDSGGNKWWERDYGAVFRLGIFDRFEDELRTTLNNYSEASVDVSLADSAGTFYSGTQTLTTSTSITTRDIKYEYDEPFNVVAWDHDDPDKTKITDTSDTLPGTTDSLSVNGYLSLLYLDPRTNIAVWCESNNGQDDGRERLYVRVNGSTLTTAEVNDTDLNAYVALVNHIAINNVGSADVIFIPYQRDPEKTKSAFADRIIFDSVYLSYFVKFFNEEEGTFFKSQIAASTFIQDQFDLAGVAPSVDNPNIVTIGVF